MAQELSLAKYSIGVGDRFAQQGKAQLAASVLAAERGVTVVPVWNKSNREHVITGSEPPSVRAGAEAAVRELGWTRGFHVDADHINLGNVDRFLKSSDFFTIDVADYIGKSGSLEEKYLPAVREAGKIYRHIEATKGAGNFIAEVSMDETDSPQTPEELLFILGALAEEGVRAQTIAPKFTGRFNKGVDYVGNIEQFSNEFESDVQVIAEAVKKHGLPANLKLSVHSGSDKFSLYPRIHGIITKHGAGVHLKTAGTTWLEELIGLAESGGEALELAKEIYARARGRLEELCAPYAAVIDIDSSKLPSVEEVSGWNGAEFAAALRHDQRCPAFNPHLRQLLHVGYKVAAEAGPRYLGLVRACEEVVARNVTGNLYARHIVPVFLGD